MMSSLTDLLIPVWFIRDLVHQSHHSQLPQGYQSHASDRLISLCPGAICVRDSLAVLTVNSIAEQCIIPIGRRSEVERETESRQLAGRLSGLCSNGGLGHGGCTGVQG